MKKVIFEPRYCETGIDFEQYVVKFLEILHFNATRVGGNDGGVDIIATYSKDNREFKFYIQCKFWNNTLGNGPIQEVYAGMHLYNDKNAHPVVITNNLFSFNARKYATELGVEIIDKREVTLINRAYQNSKADIYNVPLLMSIILSEITKEAEFDKNLEQAYLSVESDSKSEAQKLQIVTEFDRAKGLIDDYEILQLKATEKLKEALEAKKIAVIKGLEYG